MATIYARREALLSTLRQEQLGLHNALAAGLPNIKVAPLQRQLMMEITNLIHTLDEEVQIQTPDKESKVVQIQSETSVIIRKLRDLQRADDTDSSGYGRESTIDFDRSFERVMENATKTNPTNVEDDFLPNVQYISEPQKEDQSTKKKKATLVLDKRFLNESISHQQPTPSPTLPRQSSTPAIPPKLFRRNDASATKTNRGIMLSRTSSKPSNAPEPLPTSPVTPLRNSPLKPRSTESVYSKIIRQFSELTPDLVPLPTSQTPHQTQERATSPIVEYTSPPPLVDRATSTCNLGDTKTPMMDANTSYTFQFDSSLITDNEEDMKKTEEQMETKRNQLLKVREKFLRTREQDIMNREEQFEKLMDLWQNNSQGDFLRSLQHQRNNTVMVLTPCDIDDFEDNKHSTGRSVGFDPFQHSTKSTTKYPSTHPSFVPDRDERQLTLMRSAQLVLYTHEKVPGIRKVEHIPIHDRDTSTISKSSESESQYTFTSHKNPFGMYLRRALNPTYLLSKSHLSQPPSWKEEKKSKPKQVKKPSPNKRTKRNSINPDPNNRISKYYIPTTSDPDIKDINHSYANMDTSTYTNLSQFPDFEIQPIPI